MKYDVVVGKESPKNFEIEKKPDGSFAIGGRDVAVSLEILETGVYSLIVDGKSYEAAVREDKKGFVVELQGHALPVRILDPFKAKGAAGAADIEGEAVISSPMPGRIVGIKVEVGQAVKEGDGVIVVEAMKMENELASPKTGKIKSISVKKGDAVEGGQDLVVIE